MSEQENQSRDVTTFAHTGARPSESEREIRSSEPVDARTEGATTGDEAMDQQSVSIDSGGARPWTPGPWVALQHPIAPFGAGGVPVTVAAPARSMHGDHHSDAARVCEISAQGSDAVFDPVETQANAHLLAAAPELFEAAASALEMLAEHDTEDGENMRCFETGAEFVGDPYAVKECPICANIKKLRAALAKARGQEGE